MPECVNVVINTGNGISILGMNRLPLHVLRLVTFHQAKVRQSLVSLLGHIK